MDEVDFLAFAVIVVICLLFVPVTAWEWFMVLLLLTRPLVCASGKGGCNGQG